MMSYMRCGSGRRSGLHQAMCKSSEIHAVGTCSGCRVYIFVCHNTNKQRKSFPINVSP